jgi:hypothetical protein
MPTPSIDAKTRMPCHSESRCVYAIAAAVAAGAIWSATISITLWALSPERYGNGSRASASREISCESSAISRASVEFVG